MIRAHRIQGEYFPRPTHITIFELTISYVVILANDFSLFTFFSSCQMAIKLILAQKVYLDVSKLIILYRRSGLLIILTVFSWNYMSCSPRRFKCLYIYCCYSGRLKFKHLYGLFSQVIYENYRCSTTSSNSTVARSSLLRNIINRTIKTDLNPPCIYNTSSIHVSWRQCTTFCESHRRRCRWP
jgi:hypothetical protein